MPLSMDNLDFFFGDRDFLLLQLELIFFFLFFGYFLVHQGANLQHISESSYLKRRYFDFEHFSLCIYSVKKKKKLTCIFKNQICMFGMYFFFSFRSIPTLSQHLFDEEYQTCCSNNCWHNNDSVF